MRKLIAFLLVMIFIIPSTVCAENLSQMSLDELYALRQKISSEILSRSKWESVTVPPGFYVVGEDIPAGHWTIKYTPNSYSVVLYFSKTDETGKNPNYFDGSVYQANIGSPGNDLETLYNLTEIDLDLQEGFYLSIDLGSVVFEPFTGRPSPFF